MKKTNWLEGLNFRLQNVPSNSALFSSLSEPDKRRPDGPQLARMQTLPYLYLCGYSNASWRVKFFENVGNFQNYLSNRPTCTKYIWLRSFASVDLPPISLTITQPHITWWITCDNFSNSLSSFLHPFVFETKSAPDLQFFCISDTSNSLSDSSKIKLKKSYDKIHRGFKSQIPADVFLMNQWTSAGEL